MSDKSVSLLNLNLEALSVPATKLIETIGSGIGVLYEPRRIREKAKAEADARTTEAKAEIEAAKIQLEGSIELQELALRASERINNRELRRQKNLESISGKALFQLPDSVSTEKVDEDWIAQFLDYAQDVSDEEMQKIWAQLLAGEVAEPGSYSPRTLNLVRMLRPSDAILFRRTCNYIWKEGLHFYSDQTEDLLRRKELHYGDLFHLQSIGLMSAQANLGVRLEPGKILQFNYSGKQHRLFNPESGVEQQLPAFFLTDVGHELGSLCDIEPDEEYRIAVVESWKATGIEVQVLESKSQDSIG